MKKSKIKKEKENPSKFENINQFHHTLDRITNNGNKIFRQFFGHDIKTMSSFENVVNLMYQPTDAASIGVGRILFGKYYITIQQDDKIKVKSYQNYSLSQQKRNDDAD